MSSSPISGSSTCGNCNGRDGARRLGRRSFGLGLWSLGFIVYYVTQGLADN